MKENLLRHDMAELLAIKSSELHDDLVLNTLGQWDSFTVVSLMGAISQHFEVIVSAEELLQCKTVGNIFYLVQQRRIQ